MAGKYLVLISAFLAALSCSTQEQASAPDKKSPPLVIVKPKPKVLTAEQRAELAFPPDLIKQVESAAGSPAEPFFEEVMMRSANLKGDVLITGARLMGFSVRTRRADEIIIDLSPSFRSQGYLVFRSQQNYGSVPDVITVIRGNNSYDILLIQKTESPRHDIDTKKIIRWLREQQTIGSFVVTGAGADWLEARFIKPPRNMTAFARKVAAFAPDVLAENRRSIERLADTMTQTNGFTLWWD
ncbi:MAG: DUF4253 domain-containing protein [Nitrospirota bacterium]